MIKPILAPDAHGVCHRLHDAGHELVCVTALRPHLDAARLCNLRAPGFPIERVIATHQDLADVADHWLIR